MPDSPQRRRALRWAFGTTAAAVAVAAAAVAMIAGKSPHAPSGLVPTSADLPPSLLHPPATTDPQAPGTTILSGPDAPDPFVLQAGGDTYLYTSQGDAHQNIPLYRGNEVGHWNLVADAMPKLPAWAVPGFTWAPDVRRVVGGWMLYFTGIVKGSSPAIQCIGAASGPGPGGPFTAEDHLFECQRDHRGSIDPRTYVDPAGHLWLLWKSDDNADPQVPGPDQGGVAGIWSQRLSPDGRSLLGTPVEIFRPDRPWQGTIVESPDMVDVGGTDWLFYSASWFNQPGYAIGAARCAGPAGPCADVAAGPLVASNAQGIGPGEPAVLLSARGVWLVYNPWRSDLPRLGTPPRPVVAARLGFGPAGPYLARN